MGKGPARLQNQTGSSCLDPARRTDPEPTRRAGKSPGLQRALAAREQVGIEAGFAGPAKVADSVGPPGRSECPGGGRDAARMSTLGRERRPPAGAAGVGRGGRVTMATAAPGPAPATPGRGAGLTLLGNRRRASAFAAWGPAAAPRLSISAQTRERWTVEPRGGPVSRGLSPLRPPALPAGMTSACRLLGKVLCPVLGGPKGTQTLRPLPPPGSVTAATFPSPTGDASSALLALPEGTTFELY